MNTYFVSFERQRIVFDQRCFKNLVSHTGINCFLMERKGDRFLKSHSEKKFFFKEFNKINDTLNAALWDGRYMQPSTLMVIINFE